MLEETAKSETNRQKRQEVVMDGERDEDEWWGVRGRGRWEIGEKVRHSNMNDKCIIPDQTSEPSTLPVQFGATTSSDSSDCSDCAHVRLFGK